MKDIQKLIDQVNPKLEEPLTLEYIEAWFKTGYCFDVHNTDSMNAKAAKSKKYGYLDAIMYLAPADMSGVEMCPFASDGCRESCLVRSGHGGIPTTSGKPINRCNRGRIRRTLAYFLDPERFIAKLLKEIKWVEKRAKKLDLTPCFRLNGTSDLRWHRITDIIQSRSDLQFYDYTKGLINFVQPRPDNYHVTFSLSEDNWDEAQRVLDMGGNVAVVFRTKEFPAVWNGYQVVNGDEHDLRFLDKRGGLGKPGNIIALYAKGPAAKDTSGFVQDTVAVKQAVNQ